ncbi:hypothetical protein P152DRAFT_460957 [Eremomyces bilateralis CBS 781.70]|uniref:Uncharacterized protein n=1 Tax=Eremomyces bilateralis CBS 781.70 TaxID=1392243 RepID=A0A6G1FVP2_9PEZI|nr:uncharacterized protein P152DRAFT_460957 [Eremomyces bilateralis CBS 781.70]KAF1809854.1 hypothetical protein P152DRAFT_460957 [Eremomyces bilateralis CBS 781.70]
MTGGGGLYPSGGGYYTGGMGSNYPSNGGWGSGMGGNYPSSNPGVDGGWGVQNQPPYPSNSWGIGSSGTFPSSNIGWGGGGVGGLPGRYPSAGSGANVNGSLTGVYTGPWYQETDGSWNPAGDSAGPNGEWAPLRPGTIMHPPSGGSYIYGGHQGPWRSNNGLGGGGHGGISWRSGDLGLDSEDN